MWYINEHYKALFNQPLNKYAKVSLNKAKTPCLYVPSSHLVIGEIFSNF